jgi:hypothetical protein
MTRDAATFLGTERARLLAECPAAGTGLRSFRSRDVWGERPVIFESGCAWVYKEHGRFVVVDACGLSGLGLGLRLLRDAKALCRAAGKAGPLWERARLGEVRAAMVIARTHRAYARKRDAS